MVNVWLYTHVLPGPVIAGHVGNWQNSDRQP